MSEASQLKRPGKGWKHLGSCVWEHSSGIRIHQGGIVRLPDMQIVRENRETDKYIKINGMNKKRGMMSWAMSLIA